MATNPKGVKYLDPGFADYIRNEARKKNPDPTQKSNPQPSVDRNPNWNIY